MKVVLALEDSLIPTSAEADDIAVNAEEEEEADILVKRLNTTTTRYIMAISPDKTKMMTNNPNGFQREIKIKRSEARSSGELQVRGAFEKYLAWHYNTTMHW